MILGLREGGLSNEAVDELSLRLESQGFVSGASPLPRLRAAERLAPRLAEYAEQAELAEEMDVLAATLGRLEYQMAKVEGLRST